MGDDRTIEQCEASAIVNKLVSGPMVLLHLLVFGSHMLTKNATSANRPGASGTAIFAVAAPARRASRRDHNIWCRPKTNQPPQPTQIAKGPLSSLN